MIFFLLYVNVSHYENYIIFSPRGNSYFLQNENSVSNYTCSSIHVKEGEKLNSFFLFFLLKFIIIP